MKAKPHLRLVDDNGELVEPDGPEETIRALEAAITRLDKANRALRGMLTNQRDQARGVYQIDAVFKDWQEKMVAAGMKGKSRCKLSDDRIDVIRSLFEAGYLFEHFVLMNTGVAAFPFVRYGKRFERGQEADREVDLSFVCAKAKRFEDAARLGYIVEQARHET